LDRAFSNHGILPGKLNDRKTPLGELNWISVFSAAILAGFVGGEHVP